MSADASALYAFGSTKAEHERLIRQAALLAPLTERLFREAGIGPGDRVLEFGSGAGDVAMLAAQIVGMSGDVVGIERDADSIALARMRAQQAGLTNVEFVQSDVSSLPSDKLFDAAVGRFILEFLPDPAAALRPLSKLVRAGGAIAFQEISWSPFLKLIENQPLLSACAQVNHEALQRSGADTDIGLGLPRVFSEAGLPPPKLRMEIVLDADPGAVRWHHELFQSLQPLFVRFSLSLDALGDLETLLDRLIAESAAARRVVATPYALVNAYCRV